MGQITNGIIFSLVSIFILIVWWYLKKIYSYWDDRNFPSISPSYLVGNFGPIVREKQTVPALLRSLYRKTDKPFIGIFALTRPLLLVIDPQLIQKILISDFSHFYDHGGYIDFENDPLSGHLFALCGENWKNFRNKLLPAFTSGKLKLMFSNIISKGEKLQTIINNASRSGDTLEMKDISSRYTIDVIVSVGFGIDVNTLENKDEDFYTLGKKFSEPSIKNGLRMMALFILPRLAYWLKLKQYDIYIQNFVLKIIKENIFYRESQNIVRKDYFQLLLQIRNGVVSSTDDSNFKFDTVIEKDDSKKALSINEMAPQIWIFFAAGFETSASTITHCLYELAKNKDIQKVLQRDIDEILQKHDGHITYDSIIEMKYLEMCVAETLRMYPPLGMLNRQCSKSYTIPGTDLVLEKGTAVIIASLGLHYDEKYYPNPKKFDPERFNPEIIRNKSFIDMPYVPFGEGPRACIGLRLGRLQTKVALAMILKQNNVDLAPNCTTNLTFNPRPFLIQSNEGVYLKFSAR